MRQQLRAARPVARNQLHALQAGAVVIASGAARRTAVVQFYDEQIAQVEADLKAQLPATAAGAAGAGARHLSVRLAIQGIGPWTALGLLGAPVNFTSCARVEQAVGYAGLALSQHESGTRVRGREHLPRGGPARLRTALDMATLSAARYNPASAQFYTRLRAAGKPTKGARCAAARQRLHLAWAVVQKQQGYEPHYGQRSVPGTPAPAA